jgi:hypothetical protein
MRRASPPVTGTKKRSLLVLVASTLSVLRAKAISFASGEKSKAAGSPREKGGTS